MKYLFFCSNIHQEFRLAEFQSILNELSITPREWVSADSNVPWIILDLDSDLVARRILSRSIATKYCIQLWGEGQTDEEFNSSLKSFKFENFPDYTSEKISFKIKVETFMRKSPQRERLARIESLNFMPLKGSISLGKPDVTFAVIEFWGRDPNNLPMNPFNIFFGPIIGEGQRSLITKQSIKTRKFIANTTMDPELALYMANLGKVASGKFVLDPFVGSGSLLLAAAEFQGIVFGADIDYLTLHARSKSSRKGQKTRDADESMVANFEQYNLTNFYGDTIVSDFTLPPWRTDLRFECIITDPPYGIREAMTRIGTQKDYSQESIPEEYLSTHIPEKTEYTFTQILEDLMNFGGKRLTIGGRLVFWLPVIRHRYKEEHLPSHPNLKRIHNLEQVLTSQMSRRLLVFEKISDDDEGRAIVHAGLDVLKTEFFRTLAGKMPRKERKRRIKEHGHLNLSEQEVEALRNDNL